MLLQRIVLLLLEPFCSLLRSHVGPYFMKRVSTLLFSLFIAGMFFAIFCGPFMNHEPAHCNDIIRSCPILSYFDSFHNTSGIVVSYSGLFVNILSSLFMSMIALIPTVLVLKIRSSHSPPPQGYSFIHYLFSQGILHGKIY